MGRARHVAPRIRESDRVRRLEHELTLANEQVRRSSARLDALERSYAAGVDQIGGRVTRTVEEYLTAIEDTRVAPGIFDDATAVGAQAAGVQPRRGLAAQPAMSASHVANPWRARVVSRYAWIEAVAAVFACAVSFILPFGPVLLLVGWLGGPTLAAIAALAWIASGLLVVLPTVSESVVSWLTGVEGADPGRGRPARRRLGRRLPPTTIEPHTFALRVIPCPPPSPQKPPYVNAFAAGTNVVAVSSDALAQLDDRKLRAHPRPRARPPRRLRRRPPRPDRLVSRPGRTDLVAVPATDAAAILRAALPPGHARARARLTPLRVRRRHLRRPPRPRPGAPAPPHRPRPEQPAHAHHRDPRQPPRDDRPDPPPRRRVGLAGREPTRSPDRFAPGQPPRAGVQSDVRDRPGDSGAAIVPGDGQGDRPGPRVPR